MSELIPILIIISVISSIFSSVQKKRRVMQQKQIKAQEQRAQEDRPEPQPQRPSNARPVRIDMQPSLAPSWIYPSLDEDELNMNAPEGDDPCHDEMFPEGRNTVLQPSERTEMTSQMSSRMQPRMQTYQMAAEAPTIPGLNIQMDADMLVKGVIFSEILTRRRRRR